MLECDGQIGIAYRGKPLQPFTQYTAQLRATSDAGETATAQLTFETGRMGAPWQGVWITDGAYRFTQKRTSPVPMTFCRQFSLKKPVRTAKIYATALGIYELQLNGSKVGERYFAPGFTSYEHTLLYQAYDVTPLLKEQNELFAVVAGGWAVSAFVMSRKNRITAPRQAFLAELRIVYEDGSEEIIGTDERWKVTREGALRFAEFYDGEVYDARVRPQDCNWTNAARERVKIAPRMLADDGCPVRAHEKMLPKSVKKMEDGELIYDFGQNFAGVVRFTVRGRAGQTIVVHHAEVLTKEGRLNRALLRSAKCEVRYICRDGVQTFSPRMTYMGFRYVSVTGAAQEEIELEAVALYSDVQTIGSFACSDALLNRLQENIVWSGKSNFMDIPTDCPQRDERMGWTGDIAVFAQTACYNFGLDAFLQKWLRDMRAEQTRGGGFPNTIPSQGYAFPETMPKKAVAFWGDACILVPWAMYLAYGDRDIFKENYAAMKKYVKACRFWAGLFSLGIAISGTTFPPCSSATGSRPIFPEWGSGRRAASGRARRASPIRARCSPKLRTSSERRRTQRNTRRSAQRSRTRTRAF